jgi:hypothetical protein
MALVGGPIYDQVQAKSAIYGNGKRQEQESMTKLRQSGRFHDSTEDKKRRNDDVRVRVLIYHTPTRSIPSLNEVRPNVVAFITIS